MLKKGEYHSTASNEDRYQDALDDSSTRNSRQGTIRLVQPYENDPTTNDKNASYSPPFLPAASEAARSENIDRSVTPYAQGATKERVSESSDSEDSFARNQDRESTGFRDAVLAALGFSSGHARPSSGLPGSPPLRRTLKSDQPRQAQENPDNSPGIPAPRSTQPELFSLPPTNTAYSLDRLATVGLGLNYPAAESLSQMSYPSHSDTWDVLYRQHSAGLDLDSDMLDFSSPSRMSNSRSGSGSVFASAHTPASTHRSPAMMSTGPMPHSEQFHYETDEPVPDIPNDKLVEPIWSQEDQRDIALFSAAFNSPESLRSAERNDQFSNTDLPGAASRPMTTAHAVPSIFPLPPVRQVATSPRGLRPRPSAGTLHQIAESVPDQNPSSYKVCSEAMPATGHGVQRQQPSTVISPTATVFSRPDLFSPKSIFSTNTFGGDVAGNSARLPTGLTSSETNDVPMERRSAGTDLDARSRLSHLFADADHRSSVASSIEPLSGNTFSSFREQQDRQENGESVNRIDDRAERYFQRQGDKSKDPADRWSMSSFPGQPIVPTEVYRQAVSHDTTTRGPVFDVSSPPARKSRPATLPTPISTRSPIEVQNEYGPAEGYNENSGASSSNLAMGDVSGTAKVSYHFAVISSCT